MWSPAAASARTAGSRPEPGPFPRSSTLFIPYGSRATPPRSTNPLPFLTETMLLGRHRTAPRPLASTRISVRSLPAHRQIAAVPDPAIGLNFDQAADVHLDLLAEIAFHAAFFFDFLAKMVDFIFSQVANLFLVIDARLFRELLRAFLPDPIDRGQPDPKALLRRKIYTCDTSPTILLTRGLTPGAACALG